MTKDKERDLRQFEFIRNYVINVIATGVSVGHGGPAPAAALKKLADQEKVILEIIESKG